MMREGVIPIVSDPKSYRRVLSCSFGLWLDYGGVERWSTEDFSTNHFTPERWQQALTNALDVTDGYVWVYSHGPGFYPARNLPDEYLQAFWNARASAGMSGPPQ